LSLYKLLSMNTFLHIFHSIMPYTLLILSPFRSSSSNILYYLDPGAYHIIVFSTDQYGQPLQRTKISMSISGVKTYANATTTNSEGYAFITLGAPKGTYTLAVNETSGANMASFGGYLFGSPIGEP